MKTRFTFIILAAASALLLPRPATLSAQEKPEKGKKTDVPTEPLAKPEMEKELNGVKVFVLKVDPKGKPVKDGAIMVALNTNKDAMIVTGTIQWTAETAKANNGSIVSTIIERKFAQVVSAGKSELLWKSEGKNIKVKEILNLDVK